MPWGPRVTESSPQLAEGDKLYVYGQYNGPSGFLAAFMPMYKDVSDASEYNTNNSATQITVGNTNIGTGGAFQTATGSSTAQRANSAGRVVLGSNFNSGGISAGDQPLFVGIFTPETIGSRPSTGEIIRMTRFGATPVAISSGQTANVGDYIQGDYLQNLALTRPRSGQGPSLGGYIGRVLGTNNAISMGTAPTLVAQPIAGSGGIGGGTYFLVNGWIDK